MTSRSSFEFQHIRQTPQRRIILEELSSLTSHPTATEIYDLVRKRLPRIGLGTVYRNLEIMAQCGMIVKLDLGGTQKRFDAITAPHYHIRCTSCGRIEDIELEPQSSLENKAAQATEYRITGHNIEFEGICRHCRETGKARNKQPATSDQT